MQVFIVLGFNFSRFSGKRFHDFNNFTVKMAANLVQGIDRIAGELGYLVVNSDGAVVASGGDLENEENIANIIVKMLQYAVKVPLSADDSQNCKRISVVYNDFTLLATVSNQKVYIIKKENERS